VADEHHDALVAKFQHYHLTSDDELPFAGGMRFPRLAHLMTILTEMAHSNADSERVFSMCCKIDTDARSQLGTDTLHALLSCKISMDEPCYAFQADSYLLKSAKSATRNYVKDHQ